MMNQPSVIHSDADIMGGTPVFRGTRVPFQTLMDYLEAGHPLENFLDDFPTVSRVQAIAALEEAKDAVLAHALAAWIECLPKKLKRGLAGHEVKTVPECGWAGCKNGHLLGLAQAEFDVFLTVDRNLSFQQSLERYDIAVIVLVAASNAIEALEPLMPRVIETLPSLRPGVIIKISATP